MHIKIWFICIFAFPSDLCVLQIFAYVNFVQKYSVVFMVQEVITLDEICIVPFFTTMLTSRKENFIQPPTFHWSQSYAHLNQ